MIKLTFKMTAAKTRRHFDRRKANAIMNIKSYPTNFRNHGQKRTEAY